MENSLKKETELFREYQANLGRHGRPIAATATLTTKVVVFNPTSKRIGLRWELTKFVMRLLWSPASSLTVRIGAMLSLLSLYAENPGTMIRNLINDPDIEIVVIDVGDFENGIPKLERRGDRGVNQMASFERILNRSPAEPLFNDPQKDTSELNDPGRFMIAISSVLAQVWILVAKAVTAPDTAEESEGKRWAKYVQQKRVDPEYSTNPRWISRVRELISSDLSVRKFMVEILIEVKKSGAAKGRLNEMIADIGNYIEETGMAGFFLTIKYGLETRYDVLAINEFQADINTLQTLMRTYRGLGIKAPYMVLLEESIQTKFAPGNYPLLWSFAMGVGVTLDRSMGALNINRSYLEPLYYRLGQMMARRNAGSVDKKMAKELGLEKKELEEIKEMMTDLTAQRHETAVQAREGKFNVAEGVVQGLEQEEDDDDDYQDMNQGQNYRFGDYYKDNYSNDRYNSSSGSALKSKILFELGKTGLSAQNQSPAKANPSSSDQTDGKSVPGVISFTGSKAAGDNQASSSTAQDDIAILNSQI
ncbi:nucleocapsid protein [Wufeng Crocidura attenuata henipavirus 1]|nr:nucleocapsid protein [Wufeng Crocidura attenuata henipavirus 1]